MKNFFYELEIYERVIFILFMTFLLIVGSMLILRSLNVGDFLFISV